MKIRYQPLHGQREAELGGIRGGSTWAKWTAGDEREIPGDETVLFQGDKRKPPEQVPVVQALFAHGQDFIDVATGKNPNFVCKVCGADATVDGWYERRFGENYLGELSFTDADGNRLCIPDWLAKHPEYIVDFRQRVKGQGPMMEEVKKAEAIVAKSEKQPTATAAASAAAPAAQASAPAATVNQGAATK